jgi:hypothetical protein
MVLDNADRPSSLVASLSIAVQLLEGQVDTTAANGVCWVTRSALVAALLHFLELNVELELLGSGHNRDLTEDQVDVLSTWVHVALDSLALHVFPSVALNPPDGTGE